jgi:hypothetical protein
MKNTFILVMIVPVLAACTALQPAPIETIAKLPVIRVRDTAPANSEYVELFPAGYSFPVILKTTGTLFSAQKQLESRVTLSRDLYLYKHWASYDKITWKESHQLLTVECGGGFDLAGLHANIRLEQD